MIKFAFSYHKDDMLSEVIIPIKKKTNLFNTDKAEPKRFFLIVEAHRRR